MEWWTRFRAFLRNVWDELHRVTWPSRDAVVEHTIMVLIFVAASGIFLWMVDLIGQQVLQVLLRYFVG